MHWDACRAPLTDFRSDWTRAETAAFRCVQTCRMKSACYDMASEAAPTNVGAAWTLEKVSSTIQMPHSDPVAAVALTISTHSFFLFYFLFHSTRECRILLPFVIKMLQDSTLWTIDSLQAIELPSCSATHIWSFSVLFLLMFLHLQIIQTCKHTNLLPNTFGIRNQSMLFRLQY